MIYWKKATYTLDDITLESECMRKLRNDSFIYIYIAFELSLGWTKGVVVIAKSKQLKPYRVIKQLNLNISDDFESQWTLFVSSSYISISPVETVISMFSRIIFSTVLSQVQLSISIILSIRSIRSNLILKPL
jgi:hypothetical protein